VFVEDLEEISSKELLMEKIQKWKKSMEEKEP